MIIDSLTLVDYTKPRDAQQRSFEGYRVSTNAFHVKIVRGPYEVDRGTLVYERTHTSREWLDASHRRIADAISELEKALLEVLPK